MLLTTLTGTYTYSHSEWCAHQRQLYTVVRIQQGVAILARRAVSAARPPMRPAAGPPVGSVTDDRRRRRQTPTTVTGLAPHTMCRRASNKVAKVI